MGPETERLVRESWAKFEPVAVESAGFFYDMLFELDPTARQLFAETDMTAQGHKVMRMFAEIVRHLDQTDTLVAEVADLGRRHVRYGVREHQYDSVGTALLWTLERGLGPAFTPEVRAAWTEAYLLLAAVLRRASARASQQTPGLASS
jgi:hemoglobin-like flavoprotein